MLENRISVGIRAGVVAAAATAGVLIGFGLTRGAPFQPINAVAHIALGSRAFLFESANLLVTATGLAIHIASVVVWGILFALVATRLPSTLLWIAAAIMTLLVVAADYVLLPEWLRPGFERVLSTAEVVGVYAVLAASLAMGVSLARARDELRRARDTVSLQNATAGRERDTDPLR